ncbi:MAG: hypothetical protein H7Z75_13460 [Ferruginibacter sp.]|nr:hypothetical protein [Cytophagales bacterium]
MKFNYRHRLIQFFARISFSLYLVHDVVGGRLVVIVGNLFAEKNLLTKMVAFSFGFLVSILTAYLFYRWVEAPFLKLSKRISYSVPAHESISKPVG